jgi:hypothetical protein
MLAAVAAVSSMLTCSLFACVFFALFLASVPVCGGREPRHPFLDEQVTRFLAQFGPTPASTAPTTAVPPAFTHPAGAAPSSASFSSSSTSLSCFSTSSSSSSSSSNTSPSPASVTTTSLECLSLLSGLPAAAPQSLPARLDCQLQQFFQQPQRLCRTCAQRCSGALASGPANAVNAPSASSSSSLSSAAAASASEAAANKADDDGDCEDSAGADGEHAFATRFNGLVCACARCHVTTSGGDNGATHTSAPCVAARHEHHALCHSPLSLMCDYRLPPGVGDKLLLRRVASFLLGLRDSSRLGMSLPTGLFSPSLSLCRSDSHSLSLTLSFPLSSS